MKNLLLITIAAVLLVGAAFADPIHDAAAAGDLAAIQAEWDKGANVNVKMWRRHPGIERALPSSGNAIISLHSFLSVALECGATASPRISSAPHGLFRPAPVCRPVLLAGW